MLTALCFCKYVAYRAKVCCLIYRTFHPAFIAPRFITPQRTRRVTIASHDSFMRQRYGVAHAIGHVALHHLRPGMRREIHVSESYHVDYEQRIEREANDFALRLLVPSEVLKFSVLQQHIHSAQELAHLFEVAPILIKQRLADLDLPLPQRLACQVTPDLRWQD